MSSEGRRLSQKQNYCYHERGSRYAEHAYDKRVKRVERNIERREHGEHNEQKRARGGVEHNAENTLDFEREQPAADARLVLKSPHVIIFVDEKI